MFTEDYLNIYFFLIIYFDKCQQCETNKIFFSVGDVFETLKIFTLAITLSKHSVKKFSI